MSAVDSAAEVAELDAVAQASLVRHGEVTATELVTWAIERIERLNPALNAVITPMYEQALAAAATLKPTGPVSGVPFLVKDLITEVAGVPFSEGSRFLRGVVSHSDSELVRRLKQSGLIMVGKTNTPDFGMAPTCEPVAFGPTRNPWDTARSTSGSSGGSAAAVASLMVPMPTATTSAARCATQPQPAGCSGSSPPVLVTRSAPSTGMRSPVGPASTP